MKLASYFIIIILISAITFAQGSEGKEVLPNFRGFKWGTTFKDVKEIELAEYQQNFIGFGITILSYKGKILNYEAGIDYVFESDTLTEAMYILEVDSFPEVYKKNLTIGQMLTLMLNLIGVRKRMMCVRARRSIGNFVMGLLESFQKKIKMKFLLLFCSLITKQYWIMASMLNFHLMKINMAQRFN